MTINKIVSRTTRVIGCYIRHILIREAGRDRVHYYLVPFTCPIVGQLFVNHFGR